MSINCDKQSNSTILDIILIIIQDIVSANNILEVYNLISKVGNIVVVSAANKLFLLKNRVFTILLQQVVKSLNNIYLD